MNSTYPDNRKRHNIRKYEIFHFMDLNGSATVEDLMTNLDITNCNARKRLSKMHLQKYLIRTKRGHYRLGSRGTRVLAQLQIRKDMEKKNCRPVSFNLRKMP